MFELNNKIIVVTGSKGLLGVEMVALLEKQGAVVIGGDLTKHEEYKNDYIIDITEARSIQGAVSEIVNRFGRIDGWINNAYPRTEDWGKRLEEVTLESWRKNVDMHLNGYFLCSRIVLEQMRFQGYGSLVNMSSIYGHLAPTFSIYEGTSLTMPVAYSAIKGAINNLSRYFAAYYGPFGVRVNTVSPGGVYAGQEEAFVANYVKKVPLGRMAKPLDVAAMICFLMADESSYITGQNMVVDGGWSAQ